MTPSIDPQFSAKLPTAPTSVARPLAASAVYGASPILVTTMTAADSHQTTYQRVPTWLHRLSAGKVILLRPGSDPKAIQGIAVALWLVLDEPATAALLREELAPFTTEPHTSSLEEAIALLCEQGIIEQVPEAT